MKLNDFLSFYFSFITIRKSVLLGLLSTQRMQNIYSSFKIEIKIKNPGSYCNNIVLSTKQCTIEITHNMLSTKRLKSINFVSSDYTIFQQKPDKKYQAQKMVSSISAGSEM
jgi:hypothetical protein